MGKESARNAGDTESAGSIPGLGRSSGGGNMYSCLKNPHGQKSLAGYSPQGCKELSIHSLFLIHFINSDILIEHC